MKLTYLCRLLDRVMNGHWMFSSKRVPHWEDSMNHLVYLALGMHASLVLRMPCVYGLRPESRYRMYSRQLSNDYVTR